MNSINLRVAILIIDALISICKNFLFSGGIDAETANFFPAAFFGFLCVFFFFSSCGDDTKSCPSGSEGSFLLFFGSRSQHAMRFHVFCHGNFHI